MAAIHAARSITADYHLLDNNPCGEPAEGLIMPGCLYEMRASPLRWGTTCAGLLLVQVYPNRLKARALVARHFAAPVRHLWRATLVLAAGLIVLYLRGGDLAVSQSTRLPMDRFAST